MKDYQLSIETQLKKLETSLHGLTSEEAANRLHIHGENKIEAMKRRHFFWRFLDQFDDFMVLVLIGAAIISLVTSLVIGADYYDSIIIMVIVIFNAIIGFIQENKAEKSLESLQKLSKTYLYVLRDTKQIRIESEKLVPGDIIFLETGDIIPADCRLLEISHLQVDESILTGESFPISKNEFFATSEILPTSECENMVFSGTSVAGGHGQALVTRTGMETEMGRIADLLQAKAPPTPLQVKLDHIGKVLGLSVLGICGVIFALGLLRNMAPFSMFMTAVSLAVAAIPEGLPAIVTILLAIGVKRMAEHNVILRKLPAVETLGSATIICTDKTGTLTENKMTVETISNGVSDTMDTREKDRLLLVMALCNNAKVIENNNEFIIHGSSTEAALLRYAYPHTISLMDSFIKKDEIPFDSRRKMMSCIFENINAQRAYMITKGAPDLIMDICDSYIDNHTKKPLTPQVKKTILATNQKLSRQALRVIAFAQKDISVSGEMKEEGLTFIGLVGLMDPPRKEVAFAIETCIEAGIKPVMVTGDQVETAFAIGSRVGLVKRKDACLVGKDLAQMSDEELKDRIYDYSIFARVTPEDKIRIIRAFQSHGEIVCMTGDGVNDAPALQGADIGCAMGSGTDVAMGAADMILADDNFKSIVFAIQEGRGIFNNIRKAIHFLLSCNIGEIITIFMAIILGWETPLIAIQLLWVNLVTDSFPAIGLGMARPTAKLMKKGVADEYKDLFHGGLWQQIILEGFVIGFLALIAYGYGKFQYCLPVGQTMAFATLSISQLVHAFNMERESIFARQPLNPFLLLGTGTALLLQLAVMTIPFFQNIFAVVPLTFTQWLTVALLCLVPMILSELEKART